MVMRYDYFYFVICLLKSIWWGMVFCIDVKIKMDVS